MEEIFTQQESFSAPIPKIEKPLYIIKYALSIEN